MQATQAALWFIFNNPQLAHEYENTKINKMIWLSDQLYQKVFEKPLIEEDFYTVNDSPVVASVFQDFNYHSPHALEQSLPEFEEDEKRVFNIVNLSYGDMNLAEIKKADDSILKDLYEVYKNMDFEHLDKIRINGNLFYYLDDNVIMDENLIKRLARFEQYPDPVFLENVDGELVIS